MAEQRKHQNRSSGNPTTATARPASKPKPASTAEPLAADGGAQPRWPLVLSAAAWGVWLIFLLVMMVMRLSTNPT